MVEERPPRDEVEDAVRTLIRHAGDDPTRPGLVDTPSRVVRAYREFFGGYDEDPTEYLQRQFDDAADYDQIVVVRDIDFWSHCEHHMVPFYGFAHVAYQPGAGRVVGLSKLARVVRAYARRLQVQERLTQQVARSVYDGLGPSAVAVVVEARHLCMAARGVGTPESWAVTSSVHGGFRTDATARAEVLAMLRPRCT